MLDWLLHTVVFLAIVELIFKYVINKWNIIKEALAAFCLAVIVLSAAIGASIYAIVSRLDKATIDGCNAANVAIEANSKIISDRVSDREAQIKEREAKIAALEKRPENCPAIPSQAKGESSTFPRWTGGAGANARQKDANNAHVTNIGSVIGQVGDNNRQEFVNNRSVFLPPKIVASDKEGDVWVTRIAFERSQGIWDQAGPIELKMRLSGPYISGNVEGFGGVLANPWLASNKELGEKGLFGFGTTTPPVGKVVAVLRSKQPIKILQAEFHPPGDPSDYHPQ